MPVEFNGGGIVLDQVGLDWVRLDWVRLDRLRLDRTVLVELDWIASGRIGVVSMCLRWFGLV